MVSCIWGRFLALAKWGILFLGLVACLAALQGIHLEIHTLLEPCLAETSTLFNLGCRGLFPSLADTLIVFPWWCVRITVLLKQSIKPLLVLANPSLG